MKFHGPAPPMKVFVFREMFDLIPIRPPDPLLQSSRAQRFILTPMRLDSIIAGGGSGDVRETYGTCSGVIRLRVRSILLLVFHFMISIAI